MKKNKYSIMVIGILDLLVVALRHPGYAWINGHPEWGFSPWAAWSVSLAAVGMITFFGFLWLAYTEGEQMALYKEGMRLAIVASVIVVDLVLISTVIFPFPLVDAKSQQDLDLAKDIIKQFNWTVGIIAAFYFGTSALAQDRDKEKEKNENDSKESEETK